MSLISKAERGTSLPFFFLSSPPLKSGTLNTVSHPKLEIRAVIEEQHPDNTAITSRQAGRLQRHQAGSGSLSSSRTRAGSSPSCLLHPSQEQLSFQPDTPRCGSPVPGTPNVAPLCQALGPRSAHLTSSQCHPGPCSHANPHTCCRHYCVCTILLLQVNLVAILKSPHLTTT